MDPLEFMRERDPFQRGVQQAIAHAARKLQHQHDLERAQQIAAEVGRMLAAATKKKG